MSHLRIPCTSVTWLWSVSLAVAGLGCGYEDVYLLAPPNEQGTPPNEVEQGPTPVNEGGARGERDGSVIPSEPSPSEGSSERPLWPRLSGPIDTGEADPGPSAAEESPGGLAQRCSQVDFLFVIDNSPSMEVQQAALAAAFPSFAADVEAVLGSRDFHVMSIDTDDSSLLDRIGLFPSTAGCDAVLGAGRRRNAQGRDCGVVGEQRYLLSAQPDLGSAFSCIADVGDNGDLVERPMDAALTALSTDFNQPPGCNAGFLREDSLLVVTLLTDEDDERSAGEPEDWRAELLALKSPEQLVVLGLLAERSGLIGGAGCGLESSQRLSAFVEELPNGVVGSACAPDYASSFSRVVERIESLCSTL